MSARVFATASSVMAGLDPAESKTWIPGSSPGMTDLSRDANRPSHVIRSAP